MTIDQLSFAYSSPNASVGPSIPVIDNSQPTTENISVRMYSSLMGTFDFSAPIHHVYAMSSRPASTGRSIPFRTSYFSDPWTLPSPTSSGEGQLHAGMAMPLSAVEIAYQVVLDSSVDPDPVTSPTDEEDPVLRPVWATSSSCSHDFLDETLPSDEAILEAMNGSERPWDDMHHRSYFLPSLERIEQDDFRSTLSEIVGHAIVPLDTHDIYAEGNMASISPTISIDISHTPGKIENVNIGADCSPEEILIYTKLFKEFRDVFAWSYEEMPGIDPRIVEHEIRTYPDAKPVRQRLRAVNPRKAPAIKAEVEKLLNVGFIYPVPLTEWVSNPVPMNKKQGTIRVCMEFHDLNKACPKDNFPMPFIDQILDECAGSQIFSFMDGFSGYNQIQIKPEDQHKTTFICPWGTFAYRKMPFGLKNARATFQRAMTFTFHDLKHIVEAYLDDLAAHSRKRVDHVIHLRLVFERCRYYRIRLNPHKCIFCVKSGRLLGFLVSETGIMVDPLKVEAILQLPPPCTIRQLQGLQGKANFLRRFIVNYANITKGFMHLLKKDTPFIWDERAQESFDALKKALVSAPLLKSPDYSRDYLLYIVASAETIGMVLVQEDDELHEHVIYYLSQNLVGPELNYSHVEKLALVVVHAVQRLRHYILLCKTTVVVDVNPFQYVLTRRIIGGKYNKWIVILQEFDLDFASAKSKKSLVFAELISDFPRLDEDVIHVDSFADEHIFLVSSSDPWYGDIVLYLQTLKFAQHLSRDDRRRVRYQAKKYTIIGDTLYHEE
jgi:hypothetical protein